MEFNTTTTTKSFFGSDKKRIILLAVLGLLLVGNIFFAGAYVKQAKAIEKLQQRVNIEENNEKILTFLNLFIEKVLKTDKEVSFEDRLQLENAVRNINDAEILEKWEAFTQGDSVDEIQAGVKDLLETLVKKLAS